jgi:hypothetical protein
MKVHNMTVQGIDCLAQDLAGQGLIFWSMMVQTLIVKGKATQGRLESLKYDSLAYVNSAW